MYWGQRSDPRDGAGRGRWGWGGDRCWTSTRSSRWALLSQDPSDTTLSEKLWWSPECWSSPGTWVCLQRPLGLGFLILTQAHPDLHLDHLRAQGGGSVLLVTPCDSSLLSMGDATAVLLRCRLPGFFLTLFSP